MLITGARSPTALDLAVSFARAGLEPHLADSVQAWGARLSGLAPGRVHRHARPRQDFGAFTDDLQRLVDRLDPVLIIPTCEEVFYLAEAGARLGLSGRLFCPPPPMLARLHSKFDFIALAAEAGLTVPQTHRLEQLQALAPWQTTSREKVFKREFSRFAAHTLVRPDPAQLQAIVPSPAAPWVVQEFIEGEEICLWSAAIRGEVVAQAAYRPLWRLGRSSSYYFEPVADDAVFEVARRIAHAGAITGQLSFDLIRRPDGRIAPIECNPRAVSGLHLFAAAPELARAMLGERQTVAPDGQAVCLRPAMWLLGLPSALREGRLDPWRADMRRARNAFLGPGAELGALIDAARFAFGALAAGGSASVESTADIEWNGAPIG